MLLWAVAFQLLCHAHGPSVAEAALTMIRKLTRSIVLVILLTGSVVAQGRDATLTQRARLLEPFIVESAQRYGIDARLLWTLCFVESRFKPDAASPKGARGPMQFMPDTAARYGLINPHDPKPAIDAAARYLRDLLQKFDGRIDLALAAYNSGEGAVESFRTGRPLVLRTGKIINRRGVITGGIPPYPETQSYVNSILKLSFGSSTVSHSNMDRRTAVRSPSRKTFPGRETQHTLESSFIEVEP
jgi:hypothetical protein